MVLLSHRCAPEHTMHAAPGTLHLQGTSTLCGPVPAGRMAEAICRDWEDAATGDYLINPCDERNGTQQLCGLLVPADAARELQGSHCMWSACQGMLQQHCKVRFCTSAAACFAAKQLQLLDSARRSPVHVQRSCWRRRT